MSQLTKSKDFADLCMACRVGDYDTADLLISRGINVNQMDEWNYSPLILASLCGHKEIVKLLLERGSAQCDRDTFEGQRCIHGALNDEIKNILLQFDISKTLHMSNQPFASYISSLTKGLIFTSDIVFELSDDGSVSFKLHRFLLSLRSNYFKDKLKTGSNWFEETRIQMTNDKVDPQVFQFLVNYIYLIPCFNNYEQVDRVLLSALASELQLHDVLDYIEKLEEIPKSDSVKLSKLKTAIQTDIEEKARENMAILAQEIVGAKIVTTGEITAAEKLKLFSENCCPDVIVYITTDDGQKIFYPAHRAVLCKSQYFEGMFNSSFHETQIYQDIVDSTGEIIDRTKLFANPKDIPLVALTAVTNAEIAEIVLTYFYLDQVEIPSSLALDVLEIADLLLLDRLKTTAAITLTKLETFDDFSIYDILRAGWEMRVHRLESFAAEIFAKDLIKYIWTKEFMAVVTESSERIEMRQETDSIELIDDIRFYLAKKYKIKMEEDAAYEYDKEDLVRYEKDLQRIDDLLEILQLEA